MQRVFEYTLKTPVDLHSLTAKLTHVLILLGNQETGADVYV